MARVVIIGAGPAGLAAAACLARRRVAYTLVERGAEIAPALRKVDPEMTLFSPGRISRLPGMVPYPSRYPTFRELVGALERYRDQHSIAMTPCDVASIDRDASGFVVRGHDAGRPIELEGSHVIDATGIISCPRLPDPFDRTTTQLRWMHSLDVRREHVASSRRLLVVGAGASAADVLEHWLAMRQPEDQAWIAVRSKIRTLPQTLFGIDLHYFLWPTDHLPGRPFGRMLASKDPMWGTTVARATKRGTIHRVNVARYEPASVQLVDGTTIEPDLVVFATGFGHAMPQLGELVERDGEGWPIARRCESRRTPGLYVLGARYARSIASPYLRGIARDARHIAQRIEKRSRVTPR